jgi:hypothetical protein
VFGRKQGIDLLDTPEMDAFFTKLDRLDEGQLLALSAAWNAVDEVEHQDAWAAVRAVGAEQGLSDQIDSVRGAALTWTNRDSDMVPYSQMGRPNSLWTQLKRGASEAIVDAALAIALGSRLAVSLGSRLDDSAHDTLIGPWLAAIEGAG